MGLTEIIGLVALQQFATAVKNICTVGAASTANAIGKEAWGQGAQVAGQVAQAAKYGLKAAGAEFAAMQAYDSTVLADEKDFAAWVQTLPPVTP